MNGHIAKPIDPQTLYREITRVVCGPQAAEGSV
jgi:hypothetical protein